VCPHRLLDLGCAGSMRSEPRQFPKHCRRDQDFAVKTAKQTCLVDGRQGNHGPLLVTTVDDSVTVKLPSHFLFVELDDGMPARLTANRTQSCASRRSRGLADESLPSSNNLAASKNFASRTNSSRDCPVAISTPLECRCTLAHVAASLAKYI